MTRCKVFSKLCTLFLLCTVFSLHAEEKSVFQGLTLKLIKGKELSASDLKGKVVVITNIATQCGYTDQLDDLEALYQQYKDKGLVMIGVPSNDFGGQTPESDQEVAKFCKINYGVTFPLMTKQVVKGENKIPLIERLLAAQGGKSEEIKWNFEKFVIGKNGQLLGRFKSDVKPMSTSVKSLIEKNL